MRASDFYDLVSGRRRGPAAALSRGLLRAAETPYALVMHARNWAYDRRYLAVEHVDVPVISVGNLTLGGTGKTPLVAWIARWLRAHGVRVALVSRGYGATADGLNDEALELQDRLPDVPHLQNPDRVAAARLAIEEFDCQAVVLDDGFQHRRLARDLDIVLLDACEPLGFDHVFPRGTLREAIRGLRRAHVVVLSRADMADAAQRTAIRQRVERYAPHADWVEVMHAARRLLNSAGRELPLTMLAGTSVAAFCGLGNPAGFRHSLEQCGARVKSFREFPDHHPYHRSDVQELARWAGSLDVQAVICTHKDLVKLRLEHLGDRQLWALDIDVEFLAGRDALESQLAALLPIGEQ
ncbi:MAG TPA: tetraacyldisaccharide 4'-kinase [Pirellulales bacterium]